MDEVRPYDFMVNAWTSAIGNPLRHFVIDGEPQGYSVARKRTARTMAISAWKRKIVALIEHKYRSNVLVATVEDPVLIHVAPFFSTRRHCDPENVRKLLVDAIYQHAGAGTGQDKYVFGSHAGPQYDIFHPRTEVWVWRTKGQPAPKISKTDRQQAQREVDRKRREADALETVRHRVKRKKIRAANPFKIET